MGVINNLIQIRKKFKAIVGDNWDGTTLDRILELWPLPEFVTQPTDTSGTSVNVVMNIRGLNFILQRYDESMNDWSNVTAASTTGYIFQVPLSTITQTSRCRLLAVPYGAGYLSGAYSNEFTVTRGTSAQTASAKDTNKLDLNAEETAVEIDVIKKEDN